MITVLLLLLHYCLCCYYTMLFYLFYYCVVSPSTYLNQRHELWLSTDNHQEGGGGWPHPPPSLCSPYSLHSCHITTTVGVTVCRSSHHTTPHHSTAVNSDDKSWLIQRPTAHPHTVNALNDRQLGYFITAHTRSPKSHSAVTLWSNLHADHS